MAILIAIECHCAISRGFYITTEDVALIDLTGAAQTMNTMNCTTYDAVSVDIIQTEFSALLIEDETQRKELEHDIETSYQKVFRWRDHCIRTVNQNACTYLIF